MSKDTFKLITQIKFISHIMKKLIYFLKYEIIIIFDVNK